MGLSFRVMRRRYDAYWVTPCVQSRVCVTVCVIVGCVPCQCVCKYLWRLLVLLLCEDLIAEKCSVSPPRFSTFSLPSTCSFLPTYLPSFLPSFPWILKSSHHYLSQCSYHSDPRYLWHMLHQLKKSPLHPILS
jgi:hypothetical protein